MKKIFLSLVILIVVLFLARNTVVKAAIEMGTKAVTGLPLSMGKLDLNVTETFVNIENLQLSNPKGFEDETMLDMPKIYVNYDLPAIFKGKLHLEELAISLKEFTVIKNSKGEVNLDSLKAVEQSKKPEPTGEKKKTGKAPALQIDNLSIEIGKVIFKDYSKGGAPTLKEFKINLKENHKNITNFNAVVSLIVVKALSKTTIAALANFDVNDLQGSLSNMSVGSKQLATALSTKAGEKTPEGAKEAVAGATTAVTDAAKNLTNKLFGGDSN